MTYKLDFLIGSFWSTLVTDCSEFPKRHCNVTKSLGIKFRVNDRFVYVSFMQCLRCTNDDSLP